MSQTSVGRPAEYAYAHDQAGCAHAYLFPAVRDILATCQRGPILDLGCGNGWLAHRLILEGHDVYGIDASATGVEHARARHPGRFFVARIGDELPPALAGLAFQTVLCTEVIEHLYDPRALLRFARAVLRGAPEGRLILSTPYHGYLKNLTLALLGKLDDHFTALWDGGHVKFFSRKTLQRMLEDEGFRVVSFAGAGRVPYLWKSMILCAEPRPWE